MGRQEDPRGRAKKKQGELRGCNWVYTWMKTSGHDKISQGSVIDIVPGSIKLAANGVLANTPDSDLFPDFRQMLIMQGKCHGKFIIHFKIRNIETGKFETAQRDIFDDNIAASVFLRVIDIGPAQVHILAHFSAEFETNGKDIFTGAFNIKFMLVPLE
jgi:hypothetical protein